MKVAASIGGVPVPEEVLEELKQYSFPDHKGRPGEVGGSLPRDAGEGSDTALKNNPNENLSQAELKDRNEIRERLTGVAKEWLSKQEGDIDRKRLGLLSRYLSDNHADDLEAISKYFTDTDKYVGRCTVHLVVGDDKTPDVWLLGWRDGRQEGTEVHDHGPSEAGVYVHAGNVAEEIFAIDRADAGKDVMDYRAVERGLGQGSTAHIAAPYIHEIHNDNDNELSVTVHAYYPPLDKMTFYNQQGGKLVRKGEWNEDRSKKQRGYGYYPCCGSSVRFG